MNQSPSNPDLALMGRALALAARGRGYVEPNPMVGCVIHRDGRVLGEGFHERFGGAHAEPNAIANCTEPPADATAVITLEPCSHLNKKTPPCVPALIAAGIRRAVIAHTDPNPEVAGRGIAQLRAAGIEVSVGALERECRQLNAAFFALMRHRRPYVTLKWAESADGFVGGAGNTPVRISGSEANRAVHQLRTLCDAIAVSADTVIADDPQLTVRDVPVIRRPLRVILDTHLRTPPSAWLLAEAANTGAAERGVPGGERGVSAAGKMEIPPGERGAFGGGAGVEIPFFGLPATLIFAAADPAGFASGSARVIRVGASGGHLDFARVLAHLAELRVTHLLVEPGPRLARGLIASGLVDRIWVIRSPDALGLADGPRAAQVPYPLTASRTLGRDTLSEYLNPNSDCYFANVPSPEFSLV